MIQHGLYAYPESDHENERKVWRIFVELMTMIDTRGWNPNIHDERFWGVFQIKLGAIRAQMFRNWEVCKTAEGYKLSAQPLVADPQTRLAMAREPLIAYPRAHTLPRVQCFVAFETWKSLDVDTQVRLFRKEIRSAKDPQRLIYEWDKFFREMCPEELHVVEALNRPTKNTSPSHPEESTSSHATPQREAKPIEPKPEDLKTIIEDRIREVRIKRELEKQKLVKEEEERDEICRRKRARV